MTLLLLLLVLMVVVGFGIAATATAGETSFLVLSFLGLVSNGVLAGEVAFAVLADGFDEAATALLVSLLVSLANI